MPDLVEDSSCMSHQASTIVDFIRATAQAQPDHPALIQSSSKGGAETITYSSLMDQVDRATSTLTSYAIEPYGRCGVKGGNSVAFVAQALAVMDRGFCLVPIAEDYDRAALEGFVSRCQLHAMIECDRPENRITLFDSPGAVDGQEDRAFRQIEPAFIRFTSGTTNQRKGVIIGRQSVIDRVEAANRGLDISPNDRILWMLPMAHHFVVSILLYLRFGATILLPDKAAADEVLPFATDQQATVIYASPEHYQHLLSYEQDKLPKSVRLALSTSMGLSESLANDFARSFKIHLTQALGIIEVGLPVINLQHASTKPLSLGQVQPDYQVRLKISEEDELSNLGSDSGVGEVCISGPGLFDAYLSPWIPAQELITAEGFRTGDLGYFDEEKDLYMLGRRQNRINIGGRKFFCEEVEAVLNVFKDVKESRVRREKVDGSVNVVADVVVKESATLDERALQVFCRTRLNRYKIPVSFTQVEALEKTSTGKIRRW